MNIVTVAFRNDTLFAAERPEGVFVAVTPICRSLGLDAKKQRERIQRDPILSEGGATMALPSPGGEQETFCLRLDLLHGWLFTIDESRVSDAARARVLAYKRECYAVLARHFGASGSNRQGGDLIEPRTDEPLALRRGLLTECRQTFGVQPARELWLRLGLPIVPSMLADPAQGELFTYTALRRDAA